MARPPITPEWTAPVTYWFLRVYLYLAWALIPVGLVFSFIEAVPDSTTSSAWPYAAVAMAGFVAAPLLDLATTVRFRRAPADNLTELQVPTHRPRWLPASVAFVVLIAVVTMVTGVVRFAELNLQNVLLLVILPLAASALVSWTTWQELSADRVTELRATSETLTVTFSDGTQHSFAMQESYVQRSSGTVGTGPLRHPMVSFFHPDGIPASQPAVRTTLRHQHWREGYLADIPLYLFPYDPKDLLALLTRWGGPFSAPKTVPSHRPSDTPAAPPPPKPATGTGPKVYEEVRAALEKDPVEEKPTDSPIFRTRVSPFGENYHYAGWRDDLYPHGWRSAVVLIVYLILPVGLGLLTLFGSLSGEAGFGDQDSITAALVGFALLSLAPIAKFVRDCRRKPPALPDSTRQLRLPCQLRAGPGQLWTVLYLGGLIVLGIGGLLAERSDIASAYALFACGLLIVSGVWWWLQGRIRPLTVTADRGELVVGFADDEWRVPMAHVAATARHTQTTWGPINAVFVSARHFDPQDRPHYRGQLQNYNVQGLIAVLPARAMPYEPEDVLSQLQSWTGRT